MHFLLIILKTVSIAADFTVSIAPKFKFVCYNFNY